MKKPMDTRTRKLIDGVIEDNLDYLVRFAMFRVGNRLDAEDIVHDAVVRLIDGGKAADVAPDRLRMYLYRIVYNLCRDYYLRENRFVAADADIMARVPYETDALDEEEVERLNNMLEGLPLKEAEIVKMRSMDGLSFVEIGQILTIPVTTAKSRFKSGMDKLRVQYFKNQ